MWPATSKQELLALDRWTCILNARHSLQEIIIQCAYADYGSTLMNNDFDDHPDDPQYGKAWSNHSYGGCVLIWRPHMSNGPFEWRTIPERSEGPPEGHWLLFAYGKAGEAWLGNSGQLEDHYAQWDFSYN